MTSKPRHQDFAAALKIPDIRLFIACVGFFTLSGRALLVVIGFQIYKITHSALALGWLGLVEAIPAISLVVFGGYFADHFNRKKILLLTGSICVAGAAVLAIISWNNTPSVLWLYAIIFAIGIARGLGDPAATALEAQIVPQHLTFNASSWISSTWLTCMVAGPAIIGFAFDAWGPDGCYIIITIWYALGWLCMAVMNPGKQVKPLQKEPIFKSIAIGWRFVFSNQPLYAALALDLFAVLFGGAVALLPIYADTILHVGARGLGFLNAAPSLGAVIVTLIATKHPPMARAGRNLLIAVAGFGVSMLVFAFSKNFFLSMAALVASGIFDGISIVIRRSMVRLLSPEELRGRVAAANWVFVSASNELGAFESGMVAAWLGAVPCVAVGGILTLMIVTFTALFAKQLRELRFNINELEQKPDVPPAPAEPHHG